jgi:tetratricopeptide (TPR) repeat protein
LRAVFGNESFSASMRLEATETALDIYQRLDQKAALVALVAGELKGRLLELLSDRSLQIVFAAALALEENEIAARSGEYLYLREALQPADQLAWGTSVLTSNREYGRAILERLLDSEKEEVGYSAARTLAAELEQKGMYTELARLGERLVSEYAGSRLSHLGSLFEARAARARNAAVAFRKTVNTFLRNHPDSPVAVEMRALFVTVALEAGNTMAALSADTTFEEIEPSRIWRADASLNRARSLFHFGDYADVVEIYQAYPRTERLSDSHRYMYAVSLNRLGQVSQAGRIMSTVEESALYPQWRWPRLEVLADAAFANQGWQQALELYQRIYESHAPEALRQQILFPMAEAAERTGRWPVAAPYYQRFISKNREALTAELLQQLAGRFAENQDYDNAISILRIVAARLEDSMEKSEVSFRIARLVQRHRGAEAGAEELLKVAYEYGEYDEIAGKARLQAAEAYLKAEMRELAIRQFKIVAERYQRLPAGREAAARLVQLSGINQTIEEEVLQ